MPTTVFYAWQSDRDQDTNRFLIRDAINVALKKLNKDLKIQDAPEVEIDHDTKGESGTPGIAETIAKKITKCGGFIGDVTLVSKYKTANGRTKWTPNPNVMIELGMATRKPGWSQVLLVQNVAYGSVDDLPFDLKHRSFPIQYELKADASKEDRKAATEKLANAISGRLKPVVERAIKNAEQKAVAADQSSREQAATKWKTFVNELRTSNFRDLTIRGSFVRGGDGAPLHRTEPTAVLGLGVFPLREKLLDVQEIEETRQADLVLLNSMGAAVKRFGRSFVRSDAVERKRMPPTAAVEMDERGVILSGRLFAIKSYGGDNLRAIGLQPREREVIESLTQYVVLLRSVGISGPLYVRCCMAGLLGVQLLPPNAADSDDTKWRPVVKDPLQLDEVILPSSENGQSVDRIAKAMKRAFSIWWRESGMNDDPCFDHDGNFIRSK